VTAETARLAKIGPIKTQSEGVAAILRSPMTAVHVVTLLEEMPVQETADAIAELTSLHITVGKVIVNAVQPALLASGKVTQAELRRGLVAAGLPADRDTVAGLYAEAQAYLTRRELEESMRADLAALDRPLVELPYLTGGVDRAGLDRLGEVLVSDPDTLG